MRGKRGAAPLALVIAGAGLATMPANAANATTVTTLYVQGGIGATCSDSGSGTSALPFCTIGKAASVVQPGQTVNVGYGSYPETVTITAHGTASAPIKFVGQSDLDFTTASWVGSNGGPATGDHAFVLDGAQYVTVTGFGVSGNEESVLVQNSQHVTVDKIAVANPSGSTPDVRVAGSPDVTVSHSAIQFGVELDSGTSGATLVDDVITNGPGGLQPALSATDAAGAKIVNDTITSVCDKGIDLEGASTGSTIENDIVDTAIAGGNCGASNTAVTVASGSTSGTTVDYNVAHTGQGGTYSWGGTAYDDPASFAATGQGKHDLASDPKLIAAPLSTFTTAAVPVYPSEGSPEIDSADYSVAPTADVIGLPRVDDPLVADTGAGSIAYPDRGAFEYQDPIALVAPTAKHVPGGGPLDVNITTGVTAAWSKNIKYTYAFNDGTPDVVTTASTIRHDFASAGLYNTGITANDGYADSPSSGQNSVVSALVGADYTPMAPVRVLDTRHAIGVPTTTPVAAGQDVLLTVGGVNVPSGNGLSAVVLNVTVTKPTASGSLTVYTDPAFRPSPANLDFAAGQTVPVLVTTELKDGKVRFHNGSAGTVHIVADIEGYYADSGYGYKTSAPVRVLDTRRAIGVPTTTPVPANGRVQLDLSSKVPSGTKAVTLNVTVTHPTAGGYITAYPDGATAPTASNLNFVPGQTVPNLVTVPVKNGKADFKNGSGGTVDLVADLEGYYGDSTSDATFGLMPIELQNVADSQGGTDPISANGTLHLSAGWFPFVGGLPTKGTGLLLDVTATSPAAGGYLTVYPDGVSRPTASNLNFSPNQTTANLVSVASGQDGIDLYNGSAGNTGYDVALEGYFTPPLA